MSTFNTNAGVVPASLSFLAIYNPFLSRNEETLHDQIVYYHSKSDNAKLRRKARGNTENDDLHEERNERLRQIGLAQAMVEFAKSFSDGDAVDSIETEKSRIILHELEPSWWILASIDLTCITSTPEKSNVVQPPSKADITVEYSAREVSPPPLLLQQILRAHRVFLLHHSPSIAELHARLARSKFCGILKVFWDTFLRDWDVLLHGNPAVDIFNGLKLAAGGELGIGVGEEEWGSGEREVLEGFIERTEGLVDLVVSRFGDRPHVENRSDDKSKSINTSAGVQRIAKEWQGAAQDPRPSDGVVFSGVGAVDRPSVRDISSWVEMLFKYGLDAYGTRDNPSTFRRKRRKAVATATAGSGNTRDKLRQQSSEPRQDSGLDASSDYQTQSDIPIGIPPPIVAPARLQPVKAPTAISQGKDLSRTQNERTVDENEDQSATSTGTLMKYLTLGVYGSQWDIPLKRSPVQRQTSKQESHERGPKAGEAATNAGSSFKGPEISHGYFMIGLQGDLEKDDLSEEEGLDTDIGTDPDSINETQNLSNRTMRRTVHVERTSRKTDRSCTASGSSDKGAAAEARHDRLRVVVYVQQPFIFTFLFELHVDSLALPSFYRSLHYQLGPLQRPLLISTSPSKVSERLWQAATPKSTASTNSSQPICDLVYDPSNLTVHTTIPNIPEPGLTVDEVAAAPWTRIEALSVHSQILNTYASTRRHTAEVERTCKTSRGWWVVWMRLPHPLISQPTHSSMFREAFLIRRASDYVSPTAKKSTSKFGRNVSAPSASSGWGPGKLAEGIGIDARQYIEGLLSLNR